MALQHLGELRDAISQTEETQREDLTILTDLEREAGQWTETVGGGQEVESAGTLAEALQSPAAVSAL